MHLFKSQLLQEAGRPRIGPYRDRGFGPRYARRREPRRGIDERNTAPEDVAAIRAAARELLRRMADYDQAA